MYILNVFLTTQGIQVIPGNRKSLVELIDNPANVEQIVSFTRLPVKAPCTQSQLEDYPDSDLFVLVKPHHPDNPWRLLAILNCKGSFHSRETEAAFWGLSVRTSAYIRYLCVTEDLDVYRHGHSELGVSCDDPRKARRLFEAYTDRIYICKNYSGVGDERLGADRDAMLHRLDQRAPSSSPLFDDPSISGHTKYCHSVRPLDDLIWDLKRWKIEIPAAE